MKRACTASATCRCGCGALSIRASRAPLCRDGLSEKDARWFFKQLMLALDYCHKLGVSSRDIKLENTLLEKAPGRRPMLKLCGKGCPGSGAPGSQNE